MTTHTPRTPLSKRGGDSSSGTSSPSPSPSAFPLSHHPCGGRVSVRALNSLLFPKRQPNLIMMHITSHRFSRVWLIFPTQELNTSEKILHLYIKKTTFHLLKNIRLNEFYRSNYESDNGLVYLRRRHTHTQTHINNNVQFPLNTGGYPSNPLSLEATEYCVI